MKRPVVFTYQDYRKFLTDWLAYRKAGQSDFSLRSLSKQAGLAAGYLPMILSGKRPLTAKALAKLAPHLELSEAEQAFLENLTRFGTESSPEGRLQALTKMGKSHGFRKHSRQDAVSLEYLTHWYFVAIREMAALPDFQADPAWIQARLKTPVGLSELKSALAFLFAHGFLERAADGSVRPPPERALQCSGSVYKLALAKYHREIFDLAIQSIDNTPGDQRNIQGHTFALRAENYGQAKAILEEALGRIRALGETEKAGDSVYHMELALFPVTRRRVK